MDSLSMDDVGLCRHTVQGRQNEKTDFVVYVSRLEYFLYQDLTYNKSSVNIQNLELRIKRNHTNDVSLSSQKVLNILRRTILQNEV